MAPMTPEEVDVFKIPHSRMKELVYKYCDMMQTTNFSDVYHLNCLLGNLIKTFHEFIAHEQIENKYIMKKLKNKLRSLSIQNTAVCNCHKDNQLNDMLDLFEDGYKCTKKSESDRKNFGLKLRHALEDFTKTFLPHMEEEEEVFQPLLMEHFTFEELKQIKAAVLEQHFRVEVEEEKFISDSKSVKQKCGTKIAEEKSAHTVDVQALPDELLLKMFSYLSPKDLSATSQACKRWNNLAYDPTLWKDLYPVSWAQGNWAASGGVDDEESQSLENKLEGKVYDEDADIDESDEWNEEAIEIQRQSRMLMGVCKYLLPRVGPSIRKCDLAYSKGITNGTLYKIISLCPNIEYLDLTQTRISDLGFKGLEKEGCGQNLKHLDLTGCLYITDVTLQRISSAITKSPCHMEGHTGDRAPHMDGHIERMVPDMDGHKESRVPDMEKWELETEPNEKDKGEPSRKETKEKYSGQKEMNVNDGGESSKSSHVKVEGESVGELSCCRCGSGCEPSHKTHVRDGRNHCRYGEESHGTLHREAEKCHLNRQIRDETNVYKDCDRSSDCDKGRCGSCFHGNREGGLSECKGCMTELQAGLGMSSSEPGQDGGCRREAPPGECQRGCKGCQDTRAGDRLESVKKSTPSNGYLGNFCNATPADTHCNGTDNLTNESHAETKEKYPIPEVDTVTDSVETPPPGRDQVPWNEMEPDNTFHYSSTQTSCTHEDRHIDDVPMPDIENVPIEFKARMAEVQSESNVKVNSMPPKMENVRNKSSEVGSGSLTVEIKVSPDIDKRNKINVEGGPQATVVQTVIDELLYEDMIINWTATNHEETTDTEPVKEEVVPPTTLSQGEAGSEDESKRLEYLSLSGCFKITDNGLQHLTENGGLPYLRYLDLSGCQLLSGESVSNLVSTSAVLDPSNLFYCDNILDGPYAETASGCQNLQCSSRMCCRCAE